MIELLEEKIISFKELRNKDIIELKQLRYEISERINWRATTENYNKTKVRKLLKNEVKINKIILEKIKEAYRNEN